MLFLTGLGLFFLLHVIPLRRRSLRPKLTKRFGERRYRLLFRLSALSSVTLIYIGWGDFPNIYFYEPPLTLKSLHLLIMLPVVFLWVVAETANNFRRRLRHPMLSGVILWAIGHLLANGDLRSAIVFVSFLIFSVIAIVVDNGRGKPAECPAVPARNDILVALLSVLIYVTIAFTHGFLFGMPISHYYSSSL